MMVLTLLTSETPGISSQPHPEGEPCSTYNMDTSIRNSYPAALRSPCAVRLRTTYGHVCVLHSSQHSSHTSQVSVGCGSLGD